MSDDDDDNNNAFDDKFFALEYAKTGRAKCKKCKENCDVNVVRMAKLVANPWGSGKVFQWYHVDCLIQVLLNQRAKTKSIESIKDIHGWNLLKDDDKKEIFDKLKRISKFKSDDDPLNKDDLQSASTSNNNADTNKEHVSLSASTKATSNKNNNDNLLRTFRKICLKISEKSSYLDKTAILSDYFLKGSDGNKFQGNILQWIKFLLPSEIKRVYNLQNKQLIKIFSRIYEEDDDDMLRYLENAGDVAETISNFFEKSDVIKPTKKSTLTLTDVDEFLENLAKLSKIDEQIIHFRKICKLCTSNDLQILIRFIKCDLRINSGPKHILAAIHPDAYASYQSTRNLDDVVEKYTNQAATSKNKKIDATKVKNKGTIQLMEPVSPMLAEACKSLEKAIEKCPNGLYSEIKYDGERVQLHKKGDEFKFFSRNLKPVMDHKVKKFTNIIGQAFPNANDLILDAEIIGVDTNTGKLLPFGTLGKHKKDTLQSLEVCLFIFDCIYYNGVDLTKKTLKERRKFVEDNLQPIKYNVELSEYCFITTVKELHSMIGKVLQEGLEGLVLKNINGIYEPGKRHWLKVKKDYLFDGQMADTVDLVVLGSWYGSGKKGGMHSIFLMGCYDSKMKIWKTVTKVHTGLDDKEMKLIQKPFNSLMMRADCDNPPTWLMCKKSLIPDMLAKDPFKMPVWEIRGAEFSKSDAHTANGISIRFPRIIKQRTDKSTKESTNIIELETLFKNSKDGVNLKMLFNDDDDDDDDDADVDDADDNNNNNNNNENNKSNTSPIKIQSKFQKFVHTNNDDNNNNNKSNNKNMKKRKLEKDNNDDNDSSEIPVKVQCTTTTATTTTTTATTTTSLTNKNDNDDADENNHMNIIKYKNIFENILLYVPIELTNDLIEELKYFQSWGGKLTTTTINCTHALHKESIWNEDLCNIRKLYSPNCKHLQYKWLLNSILNKNLESLKNYSVTIQ